MDKKLIASLALMFLFAGAFVISASSLLNGKPEPVEAVAAVEEPAFIDGYITVVHTIAETGEQIVLAYKKHNVLNDRGADAVRDYIGNGTAGPAFSFIEVGNGTDPAKTDTSLNSEITDCGFGRVESPYTDAGVGNWSYTTTYTSTCGDMLVNSSALSNHTTEDTGHFASASFTDAPMQISDTLQITWELNCTGG